MTTKRTMKLPPRMIVCLLALAASSTFAEPQPAAPKDATEATRAVNRAAGIVDPELETYRWMLEELRVSLFAQELKTSIPISVKRLESQWANVRE